MIAHKRTVQHYVLELTEAEAARVVTVIGALESSGSLGTNTTLQFVRDALVEQGA